jgi:hypothetical protein
MPITAPYANNPQKPGKPIFREVITPVGVIVHCYVDKPSLQETDSKPPKPILDENGIQKAEYKITLAWPKALMETALLEIRSIAREVVAEAWGHDALADPWLNLQPFLLDGDNPNHNTKRREYLFGHVYKNFKQKADAKRLPDGRVLYSGAPGVVDAWGNDAMPTDLYAGCRGRASGIMFGTEYSGKRFISTRLNNVQLDVPPPGGFTRMGGGGRPDAKSQFDPLATGPAPGGPVTPGVMPNLL